MSGETEEKASAWTVDTALQHMQRQHDDLQTEVDRRMASLKVFLDERFNSQNDAVKALADTLDERYATQTKAIDAAKESQETAMHTAFEAADKAVQAALQSAEKAVTKAEVATDKRFEAVNEFRAQLQDQANRFMPRSESDSNKSALNAKMDEHINRSDLRLNSIDSRLNVSQGIGEGGIAQHTENRLNMGLLVAAGTLLLGLIGTVITLIVIMNK